MDGWMDITVLPQVFLFIYHDIIIAYGCRLSIIFFRSAEPHAQSEMESLNMEKKLSIEKLNGFLPIIPMKTVIYKLTDSI